MGGNRGYQRTTGTAEKRSALRMAQLTNQLFACAHEGKYQTGTISLNGVVEDPLLVLRHGIHDGIPVETDLPLEV
jgi:C4-dicarboxylate-specific signal transduction histidine kinase